jgi:hypothetical protein
MVRYVRTHFLGFQQFLHSDHRAIVADIQVGSRSRLKEFRRKHQKFPLCLETGLQDKDTTTFVALAAECMGPKSKKQKGKDWVSETTWALIAKQASLLQSGRCNQAAARRMKRKIHGVLKADKQPFTADVGKKIVAELGTGNVQEEFCYLKGWY